MYYAKRDLIEARENLIDLALDLGKIKAMEENPPDVEEIKGHSEWGVKVGKDFIGVVCDFHKKGDETNVSLGFALNGHELPFDDIRIHEPIMWGVMEYEREELERLMKGDA